MSKDQSQYHFFQGTVVSQYEEWPESHKRERQWFTFSQAIEALSTRPELQEALNRSGIKRNILERPWCWMTHRGDTGSAIQLTQHDDSIQSFVHSAK
ncbi:hypothetical protein NLG97_g9907 [Lecanicillium saksenae]|uniref:Uncharacterized protein n=1 Tax=Lecanicillium saksenae TaxID=468837 RepID=A0ACC1QGJ2_9HYPO|nr:hypothetical protein NLG97_g9907 [Lecanicillium saksenae]